jgi:hypothetical protein
MFIIFNSTEEGEYPLENHIVLAVNKEYNDDIPFKAFYKNGEWHDAEITTVDSKIGETVVQWAYYDVEYNTRDQIHHYIIKDGVTVERDFVSIDVILESQLKWFLIGFSVALVILLPMLIFFILTTLGYV